jgi:hypothetical protein
MISLGGRIWNSPIRNAATTADSHAFGKDHRQSVDVLYGKGASTCFRLLSNFGVICIPSTAKGEQLALERNIY